jgi:hypothetical protein
MIAKTAVVQVADYLNPLLSSPAGPLEGVAMAMSFEPSLMPRNSVQQAIMMGLAGLTARGLGGAVEKGTQTVTPDTATLSAKMAVRGGVGLIGASDGLEPRQRPDRGHVARRSRPFT